jgi:hypothetical protein
VNADATSALIGLAGPAIVVPARVCSILESQTDLAALRARLRGIDPETSATLQAIRIAATLWRSAASGTPVAPDPEPAGVLDMLPVDEVAMLLELKPRSVRKAAGLGQLRAMKIAGRWLITRDDLRHFEAARAAKRKAAA